MSSQPDSRFKCCSEASSHWPLNIRGSQDHPGHSLNPTKAPLFVWALLPFHLAAGKPLSIVWLSNYLQINIRKEGISKIKQAQPNLTPKNASSVFRCRNHSKPRCDTSVYYHSIRFLFQSKKVSRMEQYMYVCCILIWNYSSFSLERFFIIGVPLRNSGIVCSTVKSCIQTNRLLILLCV